MARDCRYGKALSAFLDGELTAQQMERVRAHLTTCPACRDQLAALRSVNDLLSELPETDPSPDFHHRFQERLAAETTVHPARPATGFRSGRIRSFLTAAGRFLTTGWHPYALGTAAVAALILVVSLPRNEHPLITPENLAMAREMELLQNYEILTEMELLENWDAIAQMALDS